MPNETNNESSTSSPQIAVPDGLHVPQLQREDKPDVDIKFYAGLVRTETRRGR